MLRFLLLFPLAIAAQLKSAGADETFQTNTNRPGYDISSFEIHPTTGPTFGSDADVCLRQCDHTTGCHSWTYVKPGIQGPNGRCWLKKAIPNPRADGCCVSGVVRRPFEDVTDRPGGDYRSFHPQVVEQCYGTCLNDPQCKAYTLTAPSAVKTCWLKNSIPDAVFNANLLSGVIDRFVPPH